MARQSGLYFCARAAPAVVQLGISMLAIRHLAPETFVQFGLTLALVMGFGAVATSWLTQGMVRENHGLAGGAPAASLVWTATGVIVIAGFAPLYLAAALLLRPYGIFPPLLLLLHAANVIYAVALNWQIGALRPGAVLVAEIVRSAVMAVACVAVILFVPWRPAEMLLLGMAVALLAGAIPILPPWRGLRTAPPPWRALVALFRHDGAIALWFVAATVLFLADRFVLKDLFGAAAVAQYILLANTVQRATQLLLAPMVIALQPVVAHQLRGGATGAAYRSIDRTLALQAGAALVAFVLAILLGDVLLKLLLGRPGEAAVASYVPLLLAAFLWQLSQGVQKPLEYSGRLMLLTGLVTAAIAVLLLVTLLGAPHFGAPAAAWGLLAGTAIYALGTFCFAAGLRRRKHAP